MKRQPVQIAIPEPCHENWELMTIAERGRFCQSCQKVVTDFSVMSDEEIILYFKEHQNICGRFRNDQMNRDLTATPQQARLSIPSVYQKIAASLLLLSAAVNRSWAQPKKQHTVQHPIAKSKSVPIIINGSFVDFETQKGIPDQKVYLKCDSLQLTATTDQQGLFSFKVPTKYKSQAAHISSPTGNNAYYVDSALIDLSVAPTDVLLMRMTVDSLKEVKVVRREQYTHTGGLPVMTHTDIKARRHNALWHRISKPFKRKRR